MPAFRSALASAIALVLLTGPAGAHPGGGTHVDGISASLAGNSILVGGDATFVDTPVMVATDPIADSLLPRGGLDLIEAVIERPSPTASQLRFKLRLHDPVPTLVAIPEVVHYSFFFGVGPGGEEAQFLLQALRTAVANQPNAEPMFRLLRFNGTSCCTPVQFVQGTMTEQEIAWTVPMGPLGVTPGSTITAHPIGTRAIQIQLGASGAQWLNNGQPDFMYIDNDYEVPGARVSIGVAPEGTPVEQVALTGTTTLNGGSFAGVLPRPAAAGRYVVVAKACYTSTSCGTASTTIEV